MFVVTPNNCICLVLMLPALITFLITLCSSCLQRECHNVGVHGMAWYIIWHCIRRINTWVWSKCFWSTEFTAWGFLWADHSHRTVCHYTLLRIFCFYIFFFYAAKKHRIRRLSMRLGMCAQNCPERQPKPVKFSQRKTRVPCCVGQYTGKLLMIYYPVVVFFLFLWIFIPLLFAVSSVLMSEFWRACGNACPPQHTYMGHFFGMIFKGTAISISNLCSMLFSLSFYVTPDALVCGCFLFSVTVSRPTNNCIGQTPWQWMVERTHNAVLWWN